MAAQNTLVYKLTPPRRPSLDDVGGAAKENDVDVPDPVTQPTAEEYNQICKLAVALTRVAPVCVLTVRFNAGAPVIDKVAACNEDIIIGTFTVTDNGAGDTSITWPVDTFPQQSGGEFMVTVTEDVEIDRVRAYPIVGPPPGVRIKTKLGAVGTDARFTLAIY